MAPSRRKGVSKSASVAAARKQWKVGDLVLAKVKGFPAWPAMVSEPQKWGYSIDRKKVLVYFFGTKQIAFCNPCDVEAFTEEKKRTLPLKRQGKGADFVRAVEEIIDSYDKSKKQVQVDEYNSGDEGTVTNAGNSEGSAGRSCMNDQAQSPLVKPNHAAIDRNGLSNIVEDLTDAMEITVLHNLERVSEEPDDNALVLHHLKSAPVMGSKSPQKRSIDTQLKRCIRQQRAPSAQRSTSSSRMGHSKFHNLIISLNDVSDVNGVSISNRTCDEPIRRSKRIRKSPYTSNLHEMDSPTCSAAFVSNGSSKDNGSEIIATNFDTISLTKGSTEALDSSCELEYPEIAVKFTEREVELDKKLGIRTKGVFTKKKRKPTRKRVTNNGAPFTAKLDKVENLMVDGSKTGPNSPSASANLNERSYKADSDKHLPLVKRARVRMGKLSTEEDHDNFIHTEEISSKEVLSNHSESVSTSVRDDDSDPADKTSLGVDGAVNSSSPSNNCHHSTESGPQLSKVTKYQLCASSVDAEAALPPSKRLHRALEAMSANAAVDVQACTEVSSTSGMLTNGCSATSEMRTTCVTVDGEQGDAPEVRNAYSVCDITSRDGTCGFSPSLISPTPDIAQKISSEVEACYHFLGISSSPKQDQYKENCIEDGNSADVTYLGYSCIDTHIVETEIHVNNPQPGLSNFDEKQASLRSSQGSLDQPSPRDEESNEILESGNKSSNVVLKTGGTYSERGKLHASLSAAVSPDSVSKAEEVAILSPQDGSNELLSIVDKDFCEHTKILRSLPDENSGIKDVRGVLKEVAHNPTQKDIDASPYSTSMKVLISAAEQHLPPASLSDNILGNRDISNAPSSPSPTDRVDSFESVYTSNPLICQPLFLDSRDKLLHHNKALPFLHKKTMYRLGVGREGRYESVVTQRQESSHKWKSHAEANAARKSFEAMLGTLSRTKESIGRATRLAIDCAKFGIAGEVVEILVRSLQKESSLHRKVDLFFLVDSITRSSHGQKGHAGDIYPSAVQAMLPRLLSAAAPPGITAQENRRQCLKVLKLWLERKTLPESVIRHHMRELGSFTDSTSTSAYCRRQARTERAFNDPVRDMEGMLLDEYGSNASFQLPGFLMPRMLGDEEVRSDSDDEQSFEAVTPERDPVIREEQEMMNPTSAIEKHPHILEDVDGELEMEDVAPSCDGETNGTYNVDRLNIPHASHHGPNHLPSSAPPLPADMPPSLPPPPKSPQPMVPPSPLLPPHPLAMPRPFNDGVASNLSMGAHNLQNRLPQPVVRQPSTPSFHSMASDMMHHYGPEYRDLPPVQLQRPGSTHPVSFGNFPVSNSSNTRDGATLHNKSFLLQPPPPSLSNQFSYVQADQRTQSWREASSFHPERFQSGQNMNRSFCGDRDGAKLAPHELGSVHVDNASLSCASVSSAVRPCEPNRIANCGWSFPPRPLNYRSSIPLLGPPPEALNIWRPR